MATQNHDQPESHHHLPHLEDLGQSLATGASAHPDGWSSARQSPAWQQRWDELSPTYRDMTLSEG